MKDNRPGGARWYATGSCLSGWYLLCIAQSACKRALHRTRPLSVEAFRLTAKAGLCAELSPSINKAPKLPAARTKLEWPANRSAPPPASNAPPLTCGLKSHLPCAGGPSG